MTRLLRTFATGCLILIGVACSEPPVPPAPQPPTVTVETPEVRDVVPFLEFAGRTAPRETVQIRARVRGELRELHFQDGASVRRGQLLFTIEHEPYEAIRDQATADVSRWDAELASAQSDLERLEQAVQTNAVSLQEVDRARAQRDMAQANLLGSKARLVQAEIDLGYTRVTSPLAGRISRRYVDPGNLVGSGEATLLADIASLTPLYAFFEMSENQFVQILRDYRPDGAVSGEPPARGEVPAFAAVGDSSEFTHEGWIDYVDNTIDSDTGTIEVRGQFPNDSMQLYPGLFVRIRIPRATLENSILVPERAIGTDLGGKYVYVIGSDSIVEQRYVTLGQLEGTLRVISEGLAASDRIIVEGLQRARPGMPVTPAQGN
jgi:RND family efflux transporter MFP subunit